MAEPRPGSYSPSPVQPGAQHAAQPMYYPAHGGYPQQVMQSPYSYPPPSMLTSEERALRCSEYLEKYEDIMEP